MSIYKSCDIRGEFGKDLDEQVAEDIGKAIGTKHPFDPVLVCGDARISTPLLKGALMEGLMSTGRTVIDIGLAPTPAFYFAKDTLKTAAGVMVTASHNPPADNGFKVTLGFWPSIDETIDEIKELAESRQFASGQGRWYAAEIMQAYEDSLLAAFQPQKALKVVVDAGNGCYSEFAPRILQKLGYQVIPLFCEINGRYPNRSPNPSIAKNITAARDLVKSSGADIGIAFDGDGDRVIFIDEKGQILESDRSLVLFIRHYLQDKAASVVYDIKCSSVVAEEIRRFGGTPLMEKSGHAYIKTTLLKEHCTLGGEISGHFFFGELGRDDGLYAALLLFKLMEQAGAPLSQMMADVPQYPITPDIRVPGSAAQIEEMMALIKDAYREYDLIFLDGIRINFPEGWALIRQSITEPVFTLRIEGKTPASLKAIQDDLKHRIPVLAGNLG
jgi:phosphomannomutase / phosphoglucomutase